MTFSNPVSPTARGMRVNLSGKQKKSKKAPVLPPAPNGSPPLMALPQGSSSVPMVPPMVGAKKGARIPLPTQNARLRGRAAKDEEASESKSKEAKEIASGSEPSYKSGGNWIAGAVGKPGALHAEMGIPKGEKIPEGKLDAAASKSGKLGKRARLAKTLESFHK